MKSSNYIDVGKQDRISWIDMAKGLGIILVVIGHLVNYNSTITRTIFTFHTPLFFLLSGFCFNNYNLQYSFKQFLLKIAKRLIIPYISIILIGILFTIIIEHGIYFDIGYAIKEAFYLGQPESFNVGQSWFLLAIFFVEILLFIILKYTSKIKSLVAVILITLFGVIYSKFYSLGLAPRLPLKIDVSLVMISLYYLGYVVRNNGVILKISSLSIVKRAIILLFSIVFFAISSQANLFVNICNLEFGNLLLFFFNSILGSFICILISLMIKGKIFSYLGKNSMIAFLIHSFVMIVVCQGLSKITNHPYQLFSLDNIQGSLVSLFCIVILPFAVIVFTYLFGFLFNAKQSSTLKMSFLTDKRFMAVALLISVFLYHHQFVNYVIPPQTGWWQYYGMRLSEGDLLYKDLYCFLQPYWPWFSGLLYNFLGSNFHYYLIIGLIMRFASVMCVYFISCRITKPLKAAIFTLLGVIFSSSYLMDQPFDYNQFILCIAIFQGYLLLRYYETRSIKHIIICAILSGIQFMIKQNTGVLIPFACALSIILMNLNNIKSLQFLKELALFIFGFLIAVLPGFLYLIMTGSFSDYIFCLFGSLQAKGSVFISLKNVFKNMLDIKEIVISVCLFYIYLYYRHKLNFKLRKKNNLVICVFLCISLSCIKYSIFLEKLYLIMSNHTIVLIYTILFTMLGFILYYLSKIKNSYFGLICLLLSIFLCFLYSWKIIDYTTHSSIMSETNFIAIKRSFLNMIFYFYTLDWIYNSYMLIRKRSVTKQLYVFQTIIMFLLFSSFFSAILEELYMMPIVAVSLSLLVEMKSEYLKVKNISLYIFAVGMIMLCYTQKISISYTWHGWADDAISDINSNFNYTKINGLEGYILSNRQESIYQDILNKIEEYTDENDSVYQFPNIPLFNVLSKRRIPTYMPIHYFDVCPDSIAIADSKNLLDDLPKMIIWDDFGEANWQMHENVFRGGMKSGQREIQEFYNNEVPKHYTLLSDYDTHNGHIYVWLLNQ